ncbi:unnamed protein product [Urochloa humidicola]
MDSSSSRRQLLRDLDDDDLEEGEYVPGRDESSDDTDGGEDDEMQGGRMRRLEDVIMASGRVVPLAPPRSPTPSSCESDGTISDDDGGNPSAADSSLAISAGGAPAAQRFACHVCGRRFGSPKAVDGHMKVHGNARHRVAAAAVSAGWAATGKRGWTGGKAYYSVADYATLNSESTDNSTAAIVAAHHPLEPIMPVAIAMTSLPSTPVLSARTNLSSGEESSSASAQLMQSELAATVVTGPNSPTGAAVSVSQQAAPPAHAPEQARPLHQPAAAAAPAQIFQQPIAPAPTPARPGQPPREYSCKLCGKSYTTHQGLGGHAAGHRNRQKEAEAAAAAGMMIGLGQGHDGGGGAFLAALRRGGRRAAEEPRHECSKCHKVFATGVALGGHMRMHYTGPPIVHKKSKRRCLAPPVSEADLRLALSTLTEERPSPAAVAAGRVRLFGIDIGPQQVQALPPPPEEEGSSSGTAPAEGSSSEGERRQ